MDFEMLLATGERYLGAILQSNPESDTIAIETTISKGEMIFF